MALLLSASAAEARDLLRGEAEVTERIESFPASTPATATTTPGSSASITGGFPLGVVLSGYAWVKEWEVQKRCQILMKKLDIKTAAEFDKVFGEIINE